MILRLLGVGAGLLALTACTSASDSPAPGPTATGTDLVISVSTGTSPPTEVTLTCDPTGGTHPEAAKACEFLSAGAEQGADPFAPVPPDRACAEVYGGPETATVTGVWQGQPVDAQFSRTDACQTARWDQAAPLLTVT